MTATAVGAEIDTIPYYLYRWFDESGVLLYVGITMDPDARAKAHKHYSFWFPLAHEVTCSPEPIAMRRADAERLELGVIAAERPAFNRAGTRGLHISRGLDYLRARGIDASDEFWVGRLPADLGGDPTRRPAESPLTEQELDDTADALMRINETYLAARTEVARRSQHRGAVVADAHRPISVGATTATPGARSRSSTRRSTRATARSGA